MAGDSLRIIHCFRSPVGGIFRHVRDLIHQQVEAGHDVGVICDNNTGGAFEENNLTALEPYLTMGLHRVSMDRAITPRDAWVFVRLYKTVKALKPDVIHAHGAKGGAYARLIGAMVRHDGKPPARLYCPHGGSIHYDRKTLGGKIYFRLERFLERFTDRLIFVSGYEREGYFEKVGQPSCPHALVLNGLDESEFEPVTRQANASDFIYIGMMRDLKGVDLFLNALPLAAAQAGRSVSATLVGDGPDLATYKARAGKLGDMVRTTFHDPMPAREAFGLGRTMVVPSRAESMPYIVLEALAAQRPLLATRVGGIPEIFGPYAAELVKPGDLNALSEAMASVLNNKRRLPEPAKMAALLRERFTTRAMALAVETAYWETLGQQR
ncbi:MAG: glycosyltransferase family 4 protein [Pseudomonadota bacterium]